MTFRFIEREGPYPHFAPDFETVGDGKPKPNPHGFATIDHVTSNAYTMLPVVHWYRDVLGFTHYWDVEFHTADVDGGTKMTGSGLRSIVMADPESGIKFATNEPMKPFFRDSQINRFCEDHHGAGVQHIAFHREGDPPGGRGAPGEGRQASSRRPAPTTTASRGGSRRSKVTNVKEPMEALRKNHVLVDGADDKYMLQIFMLDAQAMYGDDEGRAVLLRDHPARGGQGVRLREFPRPLRVDRGEPARRRSALEVVG